MIVLHRAFLDTFSKRLGQLFSASVAGLVGWLYLYVAHGEDFAVGEIPFLIGAIVGSSTFIVVLFFWNLACAPYRIERDAHAATRAKMADMESRLPRVGPRVLSVEQQGLITDFLKRSAPEITRLNVLHYASDEAVDFAVSIGDAISGSKIDCDVHDGAMFEKPPKDRGVKIYQTGEKEMEDLAQGLCELLASFGFSCEVRTEVQKKPAIFIYVARQSES